MISYIKGTVHQNIEGLLHVITPAGIGFAVHTTNAQRVNADSDVTLFIHYHWNQEQGPHLYGFFTAEEKELFSFLLGCSGIGPKMALSMLEQMNPSLLIQSIQQGNAKALSSLHGIGPKKAEQIIFQLKDKVAQLHQTVLVKASPIAEHVGTISEVLTSLSYSKQEIARALEHLHATIQEPLAFDELLRRSLSFIAKRV